MDSDNSKGTGKKVILCYKFLFLCEYQSRQLNWPKIEQNNSISKFLMQPSFKDSHQ